MTQGEIRPEGEESILRREIFEQPDVLSRILDRERANAERLVAKWRGRGIHYVMIAARGSSDNAATYGKYLLGAMNGLPVASAAASLHTMYGARPDMSHALVIAVSQSGASPDILSVVEEARRQGAPTLAITNSEKSPLTTAADDVMLLHAGEEKSIAATKTYTSSVAALALLSAAWAGPGAPLMDELLHIPDRLREALLVEPKIKAVANALTKLAYCTVIGRGFNYATAYEVALKLKELAYLNAEPYSAADFLHGPIAMVDSNLYTLVISPSGRVYDNMVEFTDRLKAAGGRVVAISDRDDFLAMADVGLKMPEVPEWLSPLVAVVPGQLLALELAKAKGYNVDAPRGLTKVTRTV
jgi:glucosamine--fructose-6-phosphate aminotransferase (isomerizing)